jgi:hypothetical protein
MARLLTFAALALVLATLSRAQGIADGSYCPGPATPALGDMVLLVNTDFLTILEHSVSSPSFICSRLMKYTADPWGNVTLNEVRGSGDCGSNSRLLVSSMMYNSTTQTITSIMTYDSTSMVYNATLTMGNCAANADPTAPNVAPGKYCGPFGDSMVVYNAAMLWLKGGCAYAGRYRLPNRNQTSQFGQNTGAGVPSATWCPNGASTESYWPYTNYVNYFPASNEIAVVYQYPSTTTSVLSMDTCAMPQAVMLPINTSLCITSPNNAYYNGATFVRMNDTSFSLILPNYYSGTCVMTGTIAISGNALGLMFAATSGCSSATTLTYAKVFADSTILFIDQNNAYFWAAPCPQTVVPNGAYCGGWNARLVIANATFRLWTDSYTNTGVTSASLMPSQTRMFFAGQFVPQVDNSSLIRTSNLYTDTSGSKIASMTIMGSTVYVVVQRYDSSVEGYAFQTGFCATSGVMANNTNASANVSWVVPPTPGVPASWLPDTMSCASVSGANLTFQSTMGSFTWLWNNSWVPAGLCGFAGYASHRMGQVSYRIMYQMCQGGTTSPLDRYSSTNTIVRNVVFNNGSLWYVLSNTTVNATVTQDSCTMMPMTPTNTSLPETQYCSSNGLQKLWASGSNAFFVDPSQPCFVPLQVSVAADGTVSLTRTSGFYCPSTSTVITQGTSSYTAQVLPGGDLYLLTGKSSYASTGNLWSAAACAWNYTAPQVQATATYCGVFADGSRLSMVLEPVSQTLTALLQPASSSTNVCFYRGVVNVRPMDMAVSPMMYCTGSNHYIGQIVRDAANPSTLTVFVLASNTNTWMNVTLSNGTCTAWETGLESGEFCTPQGWTMSPVLVFGSYISFSQGTSVYIANYSIVGTNVTINPSQVYCGPPPEIRRTGVRRVTFSSTLSAPARRWACLCPRTPTA